MRNLEYKNVKKKKNIINYMLIFYILKKYIIFVVFLLSS